MSRFYAFYGFITAFIFLSFEIMNLPPICTIDCRWEDEMAMERTGHLVSSAKTKKRSH